MSLEKKVNSFKNILKLQKKGVFVEKDKVPAGVYLEAVDAGYSVMATRDETVVFYRPTETIVEDPESPFKGMYVSQIPSEDNSCAGLLGNH